MAATVDIAFPLAVRGTLLTKDGVERPRAVTIYTDDHIRATMERRPLSAEWQSVVLRLRARRQPTADAYRRHFERAQLALDGVSELRTKVGLSAEKNAGAARLSLAAVFADPGREFECQLVLTLLDAGERREALPKGRVWVRAAGPITIDGEPFALGMRVEDAERAWAQHQKQRQERLRALRELVAARQRDFCALPQTFPAAANIRCCAMRASDGHTLPALAYMLQPQPLAIDVAYYEHALDVVLRREATTRAELLALDYRDRRVGTIGVQLLMLWCNYVPYVADQAWVPVRADGDGGGAARWTRLIGRSTARAIDMKHVDMEEFELAELSYGDDCEGVGDVGVRHHGYLLATPEAQRSPALHHVCRLLRLYAPLLLLCGVTSGDLGGDYAALTAPDAAMGAHMFAAFVPLGRLMRMIRRTNPAVDVAPAPDIAFEMACADSADLPILCGEGTGLLAPVPLDLPEHKRLLLPPPPVPSSSAAADAVAGARAFAHVGAVVVADGRGMRHFASALGTRNPVFSNNGLFVTDVLQAAWPDVLADGARKWYHIARTPGIASHFYRTAQLALTPAFRDRSRVFTLLFAQRTSAAGDWTLGCTFNDLFCEGDAGAAEHEVGIIPEEPPTPAQLADVADEMRMGPRPPTLRPPPERLGDNNTWDPTAPVPTAAEHARMEDTLARVRRAALLAEVRTMAHCIAHCRGASFVGSPHLLAECDCERALAMRLLARGDAELRTLLGGLALDAFIQRFVAAMSATSMPDGDYDRRLPLVAEPAFNYQQWQQRGARVEEIVRTPLALSNALLLPAGLHAEFEHVTATTGGLMPQIHFVVQYG